MARYQRIIARDEDSAKFLRKRTLTNLYNESPDWIVNAHRALDDAVLAAYGWSAALTNAEIIQRLTELNHARGAVAHKGGLPIAVSE